MLFRLYELSLGYFAIVRADENTSIFPFMIHGFIEVIQNSDNAYYVLLPKGDGSEDLKRSGEIEILKKLAISFTEEAVADEFGD